MALVVEDGTGLPNADAFWDREDVIAYWVQRGLASQAGPEEPVRIGSASYTADKVDAAIVRASFYLSESFAWKGERRNGRQDSNGFQALAWPRHDVVDSEGHYVDDDEVPREVKWATAEVALQEIKEANTIASPAFDPHGVVEQVKAGSVTVVYDTSNIQTSTVRRRLPVLADLIGEFLESGSAAGVGGTALSGSVSRA